MYTSWSHHCGQRDAIVWQKMSLIGKVKDKQVISKLLALQSRWAVFFFFFSRKENWGKKPPAVYMQNQWRMVIVNRFLTCKKMLKHFFLYKWPSSSHHHPQYHCGKYLENSSYIPRFIFSHRRFPTTKNSLNIYHKSIKYFSNIHWFCINRVCKIIQILRTYILNRVETASCKSNCRYLTEGFLLKSYFSFYTILLNKKSSIIHA